MQAQRLAVLARLRRVRDRIDREYAQPLNVAALARDVNMPAGHLSRQFRAAYGKSPYAYLMTRRIERATALLRRGDLSVTEVCFAVGCASLGTFTTRFTELACMPPPGAFRRQAADVAADHADAAGAARDAGAAIKVEGMPACMAEQVPRPVRNREAPATAQPLA
ncbi:helix-turn-helix transcriptional regulator [Streptomyces sp. NBC_01198]|uniref:helix-turn-helix transcriptional regulator n=1 Tax=Streptomyces sp. NBC_01198 TaxID=2903769 RepID=UPI002E15CC9C|nr:helix-turn-helix transcriptional regulator [Streptomyces sp. NBC_01198]